MSLALAHTTTTPITPTTDPPRAHRWDHVAAFVAAFAITVAGLVQVFTPPPPPAPVICDHDCGNFKIEVRDILV